MNEAGPIQGRMTTKPAFDMIMRLIMENRLVATIDVAGSPYHAVDFVSQHTGIDDTLILWLSPTGLDDDLKTEMQENTHG